MANLSKAAECFNSPILDYHITDQIFKTILEKLKKPKVNTELEKITITPDKKGAIAYIGGYIVRAQIKKNTKNHLNKDSLLYLLFFLLEDPETSIDKLLPPSVIVDIKNWRKIINRGGLFHCTAEFISLLSKIEEIVKKEIHKEAYRNKFSVAMIKTHVLQMDHIPS